jgi:hypothetical protein
MHRKLTEMGNEHNAGSFLTCGAFACEDLFSRGVGTEPYRKLPKAESGKHEQCAHYEWCEYFHRSFPLSTVFLHECK